MIFNYDKKTDSLSLIFKDGKVFDTEEIKPGVIIDVNEYGVILSIEILNASRKIDSINNLKVDNRNYDLELV